MQIFNSEDFKAYPTKETRFLGEIRKKMTIASMRNDIEISPQLKETLTNINAKPLLHQKSYAYEWILNCSRKKAEQLFKTIEPRINVYTTIINNYGDHTRYIDPVPNLPETNFTNLPKWSPLDPHDILRNALTLKQQMKSLNPIYPCVHHALTTFENLTCHKQLTLEETKTVPGYRQFTQDLKYHTLNRIINTTQQPLGVICTKHIPDDILSFIETNYIPTLCSIDGSGSLKPLVPHIQNGHVTVIIPIEGNVIISDTNGIIVAKHIRDILQISENTYLTFIGVFPCPT